MAAMSFARPVSPRRLPNASCRASRAYPCSMSPPPPTSPAPSPIAGLQVPAHALVTGASSGIGLAVVDALLQHPGMARVVAVSRSAEHSPALVALASRHGQRLLQVSADVTAADDRARIAARCGPGPLHLLFNAAGMLHGPDLAPEKSLAGLDADALASVFALNAFAPILLVQALAAQLPRDQPVVLAALSARVGSIGDNRLGGWYAYRASKAALNQLLRTLAVEWRRSHPQATCVLLHPGTVDTPLSRPFQARVPAAQLFTPQHAASQLLGIVAGLTPADSGNFLAWDGSAIPW